MGIQSVINLGLRSVIWVTFSLSSFTTDFSSSLVQMWELELKLSIEELMLLKCGPGEDSWEFLGLQGDQTNQS